MLQAIYKGKIINSFDIKNKYRNIETDVYEEYKMAGSKGLITCEECGTEVYLKAGKIKIPHFAHKDSNRDCYHREVKESEEQKKAKMIIYLWLKNQYDNVYIDKRYGTRRANVSLESETGIIAIQYMRNERDLNEWDEKRKDYESMGIKDLYFFGDNLFNFSNISHYQFKKIVQKYSSDNTVKVLSIEKNELTLMRYIDFRDEEDKLYHEAICYKSYDLNNIRMSVDGNIISNFEGFYNEEYKKHRNIAVEKYKAEKHEQQRRLAEQERLRRLAAEVIKRRSEEGHQKRLVEEEHKKRLSEEKYNEKITKEEIKNYKYISEEFIKNKKYSTPEGLVYNDLDIGVQEFIRNNLDPKREWWFGKSKYIRLINCKYCGRYFNSNFCVEYQYHSGTCNNCDKTKQK